MSLASSGAGALLAMRSLAVVASLLFGLSRTIVSLVGMRCMPISPRVTDRVRQWLDAATGSQGDQ
jgi:hypothetical protein